MAAKEKIAHYDQATQNEHFFLLPQCFKKSSTAHVYAAYASIYGISESSLFRIITFFFAAFCSNLYTCMFTGCSPPCVQRVCYGGL